MAACRPCCPHLFHHRVAWAGCHHLRDFKLSTEQWDHPSVRHTIVILTCSKAARQGWITQTFACPLSGKLSPALLRGLPKPVLTRLLQLQKLKDLTAPDACLSAGLGKRGICAYGQQRWEPTLWSQRRGGEFPHHFLWGYSVQQPSCCPAQISTCQTGTSLTHQQRAKPTRHPWASDVSPRRCADGPPGHSPEGDGRSLGWPGLSLEHCWCWLSRVFLILSRSSRLDTPVGNLPHGKDFVRDFAEALFGENRLCLTSLQFIWLTRHLLVLDCASPPLPSVPLAFSVKRNSNSTVTLLRRDGMRFQERRRGRCSLLPLTVQRDHAALHTQHPCRTAFCNVLFQCRSQLQLQRNENSYMHSLCRRHQRYEAKQL